ncbi:MAG: ATPase [Devosia sp.]|uniref:MgtC/SapB family protein n=1 Tax=Devosia sp. TaxID=1871048 RepID=UPI00262AB620|nr:MgtC/SapB family protein [Devosia sp.]MDB5529137.1 ATPase [Devosia sp.]
MLLFPSWQDIAIRLLLTLIAGALIGFDRGSRGHAAGLRTTMLVCLAASIAMIQANILLSTGGKADDSFIRMDVMRLPLGILTGVGFIGAGTILKRENQVTGVTTASTLWIVTVIGLCFGGGQIALGIVATVLSVVTLSGLKLLDDRMTREHRAIVIVRQKPGEPYLDLDAAIRPQGYRAELRQSGKADEGGQARLWFEIVWKRSAIADNPQELLSLLDRTCHVESFRVTSEARH